jgi:hypothetical protein
MKNSKKTYMQRVYDFKKGDLVRCVDDQIMNYASTIKNNPSTLKCKEITKGHTYKVLNTNHKAKKRNNCIYIKTDNKNKRWVSQFRFVKDTKESGVPPLIKETKMDKQKGIIIEAEKIIMKSGDFGYKILSVNAIPRNDLPWEYLEKEPNVYLYTSFLLNNKAFPDRIVLGEVAEIVVGSTYTEQKFNQRIEYCEMAGERLRRINKEIRKKQKNWNGKVCIKI